MMKRILLVLLVSPGVGFAGRLLPDEGGYHLFVTQRLYESHSHWDSEGQHKFNDNYQKAELDIFISYGLTDQLSLMGQLNVPWEVRTSLQEERGLGELKLGLAREFTKSLGTLKGEALYINPLYEEKSLLGSHPKGIISQLSWFMNLFFIFTETQGGYFLSTEGEADYLNLSQVFGVWWTRNLLCQFKTNYFRQVTQISQGEYPKSHQKGQEGYKYSLSLAKQLRKGWFVEGGISEDIKGRQVGGGREVFISLWKK